MLPPEERDRFVHLGVTQDAAVLNHQSQGLVAIREGKSPALMATIESRCSCNRDSTEDEIYIGHFSEELRSQSSATRVVG